jgi:hypothetical protein
MRSRPSLCICIEREAPTWIENARSSWIEHATIAAARRRRRRQSAKREPRKNHSLCWGLITRVRPIPILDRVLLHVKLDRSTRSEGGEHKSTEASYAMADAIPVPRDVRGASPPCAAAPAGSWKGHGEGCCRYSDRLPGYKRTGCMPLLFPTFTSRMP